MTVTKVHQYQTIVGGSRLRTLPLILRDAITGEHLPLGNGSVTVHIVDETTNEVIVEDGLATQNETNPYLIEYRLTEQDAAKITRPSTWLIEWTVTDGQGLSHHHPTLCRAYVRPRNL